MHKVMVWLWVVGFFGWFAGANAQTPGTPSAAPVTKYDGTYAFVSEAHENETYWTPWTNHVGQCSSHRIITALTIANGHAQYRTTRRFGNVNEGTVSPQGELLMRLEPTPDPGRGGNSPGVEINTIGKISEDGTVRARRIAFACRYDLVWKKQSR